MGARGLDLRLGLVLGGGNAGGGPTMDPRMKPLRGTALDVGDMLFFDNVRKKYVIVKKEDLAAVLADYDTNMYETNGDTYIGTLNGYAHFVAKDDAMPSQNLYNNAVAATSCYYRFEIDNTIAGHIKFNVSSGNGSLSDVVIAWNEGDEMETIVHQFTALNRADVYITFAALADGHGVGLEVGGYGVNAIKVDNSKGCNVIDCSRLAFYYSRSNPRYACGEIINPDDRDLEFISGNHNNWRGASAAALLPGRDLVYESTVLLAINGFNYSYRCGGNFVKSAGWAELNGDNIFYDDGMGGSTVNPGAHVMRKATFIAEVVEYTGEDSAHLGMKEYYTHLLMDASGEFATLRALYESMYGPMPTMYDAYLMSHMVDPGANSGITKLIRNKGFNQTAVKADAMNVTYDYVIIPAYPPEYNAYHYGDANSEGFNSGRYYHPEPGDIGLFMRDDILGIVNDNIGLLGEGTKIYNTVYRGSCADYNASNTWCFYSINGCVSSISRSNPSFRSRPVLALPL